MTFYNRMVPVMSRILTDYISGLIEENSKGHVFDRPIVVSFGDDLNYEFLAASKKQIDESMELVGWDWTDFSGFLRAYSILSRYQCMAGNLITHTLVNTDGKDRLAMKARNMLLKATRPETIYNQLNILHKVGVIDRGLYPKVKRDCRKLTTEEIQAIDDAIGLSATLTASRIRLLNNKFQNVDKWHTEWDAECQRVYGLKIHNYVNKEAKEYY